MCIVSDGAGLNVTAKYDLVQTWANSGFRSWRSIVLDGRMQSGDSGTVSLVPFVLSSPILLTCLPYSCQ